MCGRVYGGQCGWKEDAPVVFKVGWIGHCIRMSQCDRECVREDV